jgi:hypothetical protein
LRIIYDPYAQPVVTNFNQNYSVVVDLEEESSVEVLVNWGVPSVALSVGGDSTIFTTAKYGTTIAQAPDSRTDNGALTMVVLNTLSVPNRTITAAQSAVYVNVYVSAGPDFELSVPTDSAMRIMTTSSPFTPSAGVEPVMPYQIGRPNPIGSRDQVLFGETIVSFRSLLKRYNSFTTLLAASSTTLTNNYNANVRKYPLYAGDDTAGLNTVTNLQTTGTYPGNYINMTYFQYFSSAFSAVRGSMRYKYYVSKIHSTLSPDYTITVSRADSVVSSALTAGTSIAVASVTATLAANIARSTDRSYNGVVMSKPGRQPMIEIEDPYYEKFRFYNPKSFSNNTVNMGGHIITIQSSFANAANDYVVLQSYVATGEDFNLVNYTGPALMWSTAYY